MAMRRVPARDIIVQVQKADLSWVGIAGLNNVVFNPGENEEKTETTEYNSAGAYEELAMQRGASMQLEGNLRKDHITDAQDEGQARCETIAAAVAYASLGSIRFRHPASTTWKVWPEATFSLGEQGGGNNDMTSWSCGVTRSGASTTAAV